MDSKTQKLMPNPREHANIFSILFFSWALPFFKKGFSKDLELEDMVEPLRCDRSDSLGDRLEKNWNKELQLKPSDRSLLRAIARTFWKELLLQAVVAGINEVIIRVGLSYLLGKLLLYFSEDKTISYPEAIGFATGLTFLNFMKAAIYGQVYVIDNHFGMKIQVTICNIIYRKSLRLSQEAFAETSTGQVINLLSNDVTALDTCLSYLHYIWIGPMLTIFIGTLLWNEIGWVGLIGIAVILLIALIQGYGGKLSSEFHYQTALRSDERIRFMDEIICGIQVIKMYGWERPFAKMISLARELELHIIRKNSYVQAVYMTFMMFTSRAALFLTLLLIVLLYGSDQITASKVFSISSYFDILETAITIEFIGAVVHSADAYVSLNRVKHFLNLDEKQPEFLEKMKNVYDNNGFMKDEHGLDIIEKINNRDVAISMKNATARWSATNTKLSPKQPEIKMPPIELNVYQPLTLNHINVNFPKGKLIGIIGSVGSGKTSLLQALLRELPLESGTIITNGTISYACQEPWIFAASVRRNILFNGEFERERYDDVVKTCALVKDFEQLSNGDQTIIGERGTSLSGGQKARVNLARAIYRNADIYLLDDPLSAVDAHVGQHIFSKCIGPKSYLARIKATRILVTHQVHFLKEADWLTVLRDGEIEVQGTPTDLSDSGVDLVNLIGTVETSIKKEKQIGNPRSKLLRSISYESVSSLPTDLNDYIDDEEDFEMDGMEEAVQMEASSKGKVDGFILLEYFKAGAQWPDFLLIIVLFIFTQFLASGSDYWISYWIGQEERRLHQKDYEMLNSSHFSGETFFTPSTTEFYITVHGAILIFLFVVATVRSIGLFLICTRASQSLHDSMFQSLISTTLQFFSTNPSGRILNRFSKDIGAVDDILPSALLDSFQIMIGIMATFLMTTIINPAFILPIVSLILIIIFAAKVYVKVALNVERLEGITQSPIFTYLSATLNGLTTIRAFEAEETLLREFVTREDTHTACAYMIIVTEAVFWYTLEITCFIFLTCVTFVCVIFDSDNSGAKVGLAITQAMSIAYALQYGIFRTAEATSQSTAVERIIDYRQLKVEDEPKEPIKLQKDWPKKGSIEFKNVFYRYFVAASPVLQDLSFQIKSKEKIGIVGRTGAGKSSLIGAIFRLASVEGKIYIDGIDNSMISLHDLRSRIAIIPQDPALFSGSLRRNLDPFEEYSDDDVWRALEDVDLREIASSSMGLLTEIMTRGSNFSVGQRQLICLARAILRKNRIIILDEATANVDPLTDLLIQRTIRKRFADCTVLTVAHRLHSIIDSDRILVMDSGRAIEFDNPHNLLKIENGIFHGMVKALGTVEYNRLVPLALKKYKEKIDYEIE